MIILRYTGAATAAGDAHHDPRRRFIAQPGDLVGFSDSEAEQKLINEAGDWEKFEPGTRKPGTKKSEPSESIDPSESIQRGVKSDGDKRHIGSASQAD